MSRGLSVEKYFSRAGAHPYEDIWWDNRDAVIGGPDNPVFEQRGIQFPSSWSQNATNIVAQKYFRGSLDSPDREHSVKQMIDRVVGRIGEEGWRGGYFETAQDRENFEHELTYILVNQVASFNSPVWFNVGWKDPGDEACSACFILSVEDDMESILEWNTQEGRIFKGGSGSGINLSNIRGSGEPLSRGGTASGPLSFMRGADSWAGAIKSGGTCLAPYQKVWTEQGAVAVKDLSDSNKDFVVLSWDPPSNRYKAKTARAFPQSNPKQVMRIKTDKGKFDLTYDHPVKLSTGEFVKVEDLNPGMSLFSGTVSDQKGYYRMGLRDGKKTKRRWHTMIAEDILGEEVSTGTAVHHINGNKKDNCLENLEVVSQSRHSLFHSKERVERGDHIFQRESFPKSGNHNPMHRSNPRWQDQEWVDRYSSTKSKELIERGDATKLQNLAATQRMINVAFELINSGHNIDTFEEYIKARREVIGKIPSIKSVQNSIESRFGSYEKFKETVAASNHRIESITSLGETYVYDVEVDCPTSDDKTPDSGHNFVIWPIHEESNSGIVVSNTRRAAKMVVLDDDHPDLEDFIWCKAKEEEKAKILQDSGFDMRLDSDSFDSVQFQNANNSVRATDKFMMAATGGRDWSLRARTTGKSMGSENASDLLDQMAEAAWQCADPGLQFEDTIQKWHTCPNSGRISASNPCSEFMHVDNSACNLASLNLMKFRGENGMFKVKDFKHAVNIMILAQEIIVGFSKYPTDKIKDNAHSFRQLGIGYTNLGALLMSNGIPYDSDEGRTTAAGITSLLSGQSYLQSAAIAGSLGPYSSFYGNEEPHHNVIDNHTKNSEKLYQAHCFSIKDSYLLSDALITWESAQRLGRQNGFRNSQVSVIAPTGTISFMLDADTTGIEPDFSVVKHKELVGGGNMKIVNGSVERSLETLGYSYEDIEEIVDYIQEEETLIGAPHIEENHLPVFDMAVGKRSISPEGHVKMMAAVQPFVSGAISKTVNMPESSTKLDIRDIFVLAWELGVKAIAIYRDGSKTAQALKTKKSEEPPPKESAIVSRRRMPKERESVTHKFTIGGHEGYITAGKYEDGTVGEVFLTDIGKEGSTMRGMLNAFATSVSIGLQHGVPLDTYVRKFSYMRFEPEGFTGNPELSSAKSIPDYIVRWLDLKFGEREPDVEIDSAESIFELPSVDGNSCGECGSLMVRTGSCMTCPSCGSNTGCG